MTGRAASIPKLAFNVNEAATALGIGRTKLYELIDSGELETFKWCGRRLIRADVLAEALNRASGRAAA